MYRRSKGNDNDMIEKCGRNNDQTAAEQQCVPKACSAAANLAVILAICCFSVVCKKQQKCNGKIQT